MYIYVSDSLLVMGHGRLTGRFGPIVSRPKVEPDAVGINKPLSLALAAEPLVTFLTKTEIRAPPRTEKIQVPMIHFSHSSSKPGRFKNSVKSRRKSIMQVFVRLRVHDVPRDVPSVMAVILFLCSWRTKGESVMYCGQGAEKIFDRTAIISCEEDQVTYTQD
jgi:hypothetical protein